MSGGHAVKTLSMKQLSLAAAITAASSLSSAGPLAPIIEPLAEGLAGTPLDAIIAPLNEIDSQLSALDGGGDNPLQPILDQLQGGGSGGDNPLQPILDQLQGGGENPLAPYALQLTKTVDDLANDLAGQDGTVDAVTDVVDTLATDPAAVQASVEAIPPTLEVLFAHLQENLMGFAPEGGSDGGDNPLQPLLDQLQGGGEGDNPLQPLVDQFESAAAGGEGGESDNPLQPVLDVLPIPAPSEGGDSDSEPSALPLSLAFSFESAAFSFSFGFDGQEPVFELPTP